eukprot:337111_1
MSLLLLIAFLTFQKGLYVCMKPMALIESPQLAMTNTNLPMLTSPLGSLRRHRQNPLESEMRLESVLSQDFRRETALSDSGVNITMESKGKDSGITKSNSNLSLDLNEHVIGRQSETLPPSRLIKMFRRCVDCICCGANSAKEEKAQNTRRKARELRLMKVNQIIG